MVASFLKYFGEIYIFIRSNNPDYSGDLHAEAAGAGRT